MNAVTASQFKSTLRKIGAAWISDKSEPIIGIFSGLNNNERSAMEYGVKKGLVSVKKDGKYDSFHFTDSGMEFLVGLKKTTCAFTGRACRNAF